MDRLIAPTLALAAAALGLGVFLPVVEVSNLAIFANRFSIAEMARAGIVLNLIGALVIATVVSTFGLAVLDIDLDTMPDWASSISNGEHER